MEEVVTLTIDQIAEICHELNRAYCRALGDETQVAWAEAPDWQRASAIDGVQAIRHGRVKHPRDSHTNWAAAKAAEGWCWGEVKDPEQKTHPCLVPFDRLPPEQQAKDELFFHTVMALLPLAGDEGTRRKR